MKETEEERIAPPVMLIDNISISYGDDKYAVKNVSAKILGNSITAIMGPSGCGKTTLLRAINRMHELYPNIHTKGKIWLNGNNIYDMPTINLRRKIGMVFQRPNPFPTLSIFDNVIAGYKLNGIHLKKSEREEIVETSLKDVALWDEVKDSLHSKGNFLSGGQQQRLCIARTIAFRPEVILLDEPTSALDPISTAKIEDLLVGLKKNYTIIMVTQKMFTTPSDPRTEAYLTGKFG